LNFAVFDESSCELQTLRTSETTGQIVSLRSRGLTSFLFGCLVESFEKLLAELTISLGDQAQDFAADVWSAPHDNRPALGFHPLHVFRAFLRSFCIDNLCRFPGTPEHLSRPLRIRIPEHIRGPRLHPGSSRLILKTARLIRETGNERNRNGPLLRCLGVRFFIVCF
jgi:hypothetical protein